MPRRKLIHLGGSQSKANRRNSEVYRRPSDDDAGGHSGYNEAVDVWSIGCLAGTLLTNAFLFPRERSSRAEDTDNGESSDLSVAFLSLIHI